MSSLCLWFLQALLWYRSPLSVWSHNAHFDQLDSVALELFVEGGYSELRKKKVEWPQPDLSVLPSDSRDSRVIDEEVVECGNGDKILKSGTWRQHEIGSTRNVLDGVVKVLETDRR